MQELTLTTPALLFSAVSLILLAYTNRFMGYSSLVRQLYDGFRRNPEDVIYQQIKNLSRRLKLIRQMQLMGALSLLFSTVAMFFIFVQLQLFGVIAFTLGMLALITSLALSIWEIQISTKSMELHLKDMEASKNQCELPKK